MDRMRIGLNLGSKIWGLIVGVITLHSFTIRGNINSIYIMIDCIFMEDMTLEKDQKILCGC